MRLLKSIGVGLRRRTAPAASEAALASEASPVDQGCSKCRSLEQENRDLKLQIRLLRQRKDSTEELLHSIRDAVLVTDAQDRLTLANPSAQELFGFTLEQGRQTPVEDCIREPELCEKILRVRESRVRHVRHELTFVRNGGPRTYEATFSCVTGEDGRPQALVTVLHDITREKEIARMKNDFVSHVSHELKTPLASINAYAEMLVDGEAQDEETIRQFCSIIQGQAQRLNRLIEDILNISRIESGLIKVAKEHQSMALIIREAVEMIAGYAREKNITIHSQAPIIYDQAYVDKDMMSQVIINLLSNAVKYTPAGGEVRVNLEVNEADNRLTVTVTDTGMGIPPEDVEHVFDKFFRVEAGEKAAKGTGLGLNLVKQIVETVHEGRVFAVSEVGKGSTFGFELPLLQTSVVAAR
jgi:two-component system phosphate regulon sensor histidine kinase PhoR